MATKKAEAETEKDAIAAIGSQAKQVIESLAKGLGVAVTELWSIFVRQYIVRGINELFTAIIMFTIAFFMWGYLRFWALIPVAIGIGFIYGAIAYLGNPKYYALEDITKKIKGFKGDKSSREEIIRF